MSTTLFKEVSYSLNKLIQDIEIGEIGLPELQRRKLMAKVIRDGFESMNEKNNGGSKRWPRRKTK